MRTTVNINNNLYTKLNEASNKLNLSTNEIIAMLLNITISKNILEVSTFKSIRYQERDPDKNWRQLHVTYEPPVYEKGLDSRNFFKFSVSFIISFAIIRFLDKLIEKLLNSKDQNKIMDNYPLNYIVIANIYNNIHGFIVLWGIPEEKHLKNLMT